jgi:hypothetical protein
MDNVLEAKGPKVRRQANDEMARYGWKGTARKAHVLSAAEEKSSHH